MFSKGISPIPKIFRIFSAYVIDIITGDVIIEYMNATHNAGRQHKGTKMIQIDYTVRNHNGQCSYGVRMNRDAIPASHADWIDSALIEGDIKGDGDVITVEGGTMYAVYAE